MLVNLWLTVFKESTASREVQQSGAGASHAAHSSVAWAVLRVATGFTLRAQRSHQELWGRGLQGAGPTWAACRCRGHEAGSQPGGVEPEPWRSGEVAQGELGPPL